MSVSNHEPSLQAVSALTGGHQAQGLPSRHRMALDAITRAAIAGERCPSNNALCELLDCKSPSGPSAILTSLEKIGLIKVDRFGTSREVFIVALGKSTAGITGSRQPHWRFSDQRDRQPTKQRAYAPRSRDLAPVEREPLPPAVSRDPCPRCGTRSDIGCAHSAARLTMGAFA